MNTLKSFILVSLVALLLFVARGSVSEDEQAERAPLVPSAEQALVQEEKSDLNGSADYRELDAIMADITAQMHQPNILQSDILRGWYLGTESDKKYGTPDTWVFVDDGENSKWMSPNLLEEEYLESAEDLCRQTGGRFVISCLETAVERCAYVGESHCVCAEETAWKEGQGCIMLTERGGFMAVNSKELQDGWYFGERNQKKLNTPSDWVWEELGRRSAWHEPDME